MGLYEKFCQWSTDATFVPHGKRCDLCGKKLGFLKTGFWSINTRHLADGVLCSRCYEKLEVLGQYSGKWIPKAHRKKVPFQAILKNSPLALTVQEAKTVLEAPTVFGQEELSAMGAAYTALFRMESACFIEPTPVQVGIARSKQLQNKLVLFGFVQLGQFQKGDSVLICGKESQRKATVLEAYVYDCPENDLDAVLKAHLGKQRLVQWQTGWLVLDDSEPVEKNTSVVG